MYFKNDLAYTPMKIQGNAEMQTFLLWKEVRTIKPQEILYDKRFEYFIS